MHLRVFVLQYCGCQPMPCPRSSQEPVLALRPRARAVDVEVGVLVERSAVAAAAAAAQAVGMRVSLPSLCNYTGGSAQADSCGPEEYFDCGDAQLLSIILPDTWPSAAAAEQWSGQGGAVLDIFSPDFPFVLHVPPSPPPIIHRIRSALASSPSPPPYREELRRHVETMLKQMKMCERVACVVAVACDMSRHDVSPIGCRPISFFSRQPQMFFACSHSSLRASGLEDVGQGFEDDGSESKFTCVLAYSMKSIGSAYEIMRAAGGFE